MYDLHTEWNTALDQYDAEMSQMYVLLAKERQEVAYKFVQALQSAQLFREDSMLAQMVRVLS